MHDLTSTTIAQDARDILEAVDLSVLDGKSILITGASGLLGTYFISCLRELVARGRGPATTCAVMQSVVSPSMASLYCFSGATNVQMDLSDTGNIRDLGQFDFIIHAAGYGQPGRFMEDQIKTIKLNTNTTIALFKQLKPGGRFLFLSTSEVYSGLEAPAYREDQIGSTNTDHPRACYIESKRCGEAICKIYNQMGVYAASARLALAYGPGTRPGDRRVINVFMERGIRNGKIHLQDNGAARRTYCYVGDAVEILWHILLRGTRPIYNVGGNSRTTISELADRIGALLGVPVEYPLTNGTLDGAPTDVCLDMKSVEQEFGKRKYTNISVGLERTVNWQKSLYAEAQA
jgi:nucleoside-diphosphate-sugar epimerase